MKEVLFRGKRVDNEEWVFGYLVDEYIVSFLQIDKYDEKHDLFKCDCIIHEVIPETVGQYIGLSDKNGTKIFEGDKNKKGQVVQYFSNLAAFGFKHPNYTAITFLGQFKDEVIGNIHDVKKNN